MRGDVVMRSKKSRLAKPPPGALKLWSIAPTWSSSEARHEDAVALPLTVEPVAAADEVPDVEEPVAVDGPFDLLEEAVLVVLVVALRDGLVLLAGAHVPLLRC